MGEGMDVGGRGNGKVSGCSFLVLVLSLGLARGLSIGLGRYISCSTLRCSSLLSSSAFPVRWRQKNQES